MKRILVIMTGLAVLFSSLLSVIIGVSPTGIIVSADSPAYSTFTTSISGSEYDAVENISGCAYNTSHLLLSYVDNSSIGLVFTGVLVPQGATILRAWVGLKSLDADIDKYVSGTVYGELTDDARPFDDISHILSRDRTSINISGSGEGFSGSEWVNISVGKQIQEIVSAGDWALGNNLGVLLIADIESGNQGAVFDSYDGNISAAPILYIDYITNGNNHYAATLDGQTGVFITVSAPNSSCTDYHVMRNGSESAVLLTICAYGAHLYNPESGEYGIYRGVAAYNTSIIPDDETVTAVNFTSMQGGFTETGCVAVTTFTELDAFPLVELEESPYFNISYYQEKLGEFSGDDFGGDGLATINLDADVINISGITAFGFLEDGDFNDICPVDQVMGLLVLGDDNFLYPNIGSWLDIYTDGAESPTPTPAPTVPCTPIPTPAPSTPTPASTPIPDNIPMDWDVMQCENGSGDIFYGLWGSDGYVFAVGGEQGAVRYRIDFYNGSTWDTWIEGNDPETTLYTVWGTSLDNIWFAGRITYQILVYPPWVAEYETIWRYNNGALSLVQVKGSTAKERIYSIFGTNESNIYTAGNNCTLRYVPPADPEEHEVGDEGYFIPILNISGANMRGLWGTSYNNIYSVGYQDPSFAGIITHFNGSNWTSQNMSPYKSLLGIWGSSASDIFVAGANVSTGGVVLHYNGQSWGSMYCGSAYYLRGIWGTSASNVFAVGDHGTILHYNGHAWTAMNSGTTEVLYGIWGTGTDVYACGANSTIVHYDYINHDSELPPSVTTLNATYITMTTARMRGYIDNDYGSSCDVLFEYTWENTTPYGVTITQYGKTTGDTPITDIEGLGVGTIYQYRIVATNQYGTSYGAWVNFTTKITCVEPSELRGVSSRNNVSLSWVKGSGAANTLIRYKFGSYPTSPTDGLLVCLTAGATYHHTNLRSGTTYYYSAWSENGAGGYSTNYTSCMVTTYIGSTSATTNTTLAPTTPSNWFTSVDYTHMSHFPLYGFFNMIADTGHIPRNTFWFVLAMFFTVIASLFVYRVSEGNLLAAILFAAVLLSVATPMRLVPGLMTGMFLVFAVGLSYKELAK